MAERSEAKSAKRSFVPKINIQNISNFNFDVKVRFALLASLHSAIISDN